MLVLILALFFVHSGSALAAMNCPVDGDNQYPNIVRIKYSEEAIYVRSCTGALMKGCKILTAAHCVRNKKDTEIAVRAGFQIFSGPNGEKTLGPVTDIKIHPKYHKMFDYYDVAVVSLEYCDDAGLEVDFNPVDINSEVTIGGFGDTIAHSGNADGKKRIGVSSLGRVDGQYICVKPSILSDEGLAVLSGPRCLVLSGDSGSPMVQAGRIYGVYGTDNEVWFKNGITSNEGCGVNLSNPEIRSFLEPSLSISP